MKIFLIGFMGCGKTTLAKKLAVRLGYQLIDLDHLIEEKLGTTVASFFAEHGETAFRQLESDTLKSLDQDQNAIIATGGGTPCYFDNMAWMNANGKTIYIEMPAAALAKRLENAKTKRPLIKDLDHTALLHFIKQKLLERAPHYEQAMFTVSGINLSVEDLKVLILANA
ncbi:shikimate kinase [Pedobacter sp.]|uniref:shikimate kinase n=1 Tax=Pedobacter sp. TaxID=1411316 RepID=UPI003D7F4EE3